MAGPRKWPSGSVNLRLPILGTGALLGSGSSNSIGRLYKSIDSAAETAKRQAREQRRAVEQAIIFSIVYKEVYEALREIAEAPLKART